MFETNRNEAFIMVYSALKNNAYAIARIWVDDDGIHLNFNESIRYTLPVNSYIDRIDDLLKEKNIEQNSLGSFVMKDDKKSIYDDHIKFHKKKANKIFDIYELTDFLFWCNNEDLVDFDKRYIYMVNNTKSTALNMLINNILGKKYYNEGMDTYQCTRISTSDILAEFDKLKFKIKVFQGTTISLVILLILELFIYALRK